MMMMMMMLSCTEDYISAPFRVEKLSLYKDGDNADKFFRPALRSLLVNYTLLLFVIDFIALLFIIINARHYAWLFISHSVLR